MTRLIRIVRHCLVGIALAAAPSAAVAGGFASARFGSEHGHPATDHPTALYYNPAGLALGSGTRLYVEGLFAYRTVTYDRPEGAIDNPGTGTPDEATAANAGRATLQNALVSPFVGIVSDFGVRNLGVGLGAYVPFGGSATWDKNDGFEGNAQYPGAVDGVQRWASIDGTQTALYVTLAGAYRFERAGVSVGAGLNLVREAIETVRARNVFGTDDLVAADGSIVEGRTLVDVSGTTASIGAGVLWQPTDALAIGVSYQSQPGFGEHGLEGTLVNKFGNGPVTESDVELRHSLPDIVRAGVRWRAAPDVELRLAGDYQRWSVFDKQCLLDLADENRKCALNPDGSVDTAAGGSGIIVNVPRDYHDSFGVRAGASYWLAPAFETFAGIGFDSNAVPDETIDPALMDMNKIIGTLGVRHAWLGDALALSISATAVAYFERTAPPRPRDSDGKAIAPQPPSRNADGAGTYNQTVALLAVGLQYTF
ncbi:MAG: hypothetical protein D6689_21430 [Deltaproteobacteria bacterium]|nr:MAG: hypothetical protein D6689_21430 [Deltaproteobacteria bacterium]